MGEGGALFGILAALSLLMGVEVELSGIGSRRSFLRIIFAPNLALWLVGSGGPRCAGVPLGGRWSMFAPREHSGGSDSGGY